MEQQKITILSKRKAGIYRYHPYPTSVQYLGNYSKLSQIDAENRKNPYSTEAWSNVHEYRGPEIYKNPGEMQFGYETYDSTAETQQQDVQPTQPGKKSVRVYRRGHPWGSLSYSDLITVAILSTEEKRMTLEQIYKWLVSNVSYFADKLWDKSKVSWKNTVRCTLSTRRRFVRIPGTVQTKVSSYRGWWTVNQSMISDELRPQLWLFQQSKRPSQISSPVINSYCSLQTVNGDVATNHSPQTTSRDTQTEMSRCCGCHYLLAHRAPYWQMVSSLKANFLGGNLYQ